MTHENYQTLLLTKGLAKIDKRIVQGFLKIFFQL